MAQEKNTLVERPPIVAVLGHVDHGKSTLLDFIRKKNTVAHEAGGITQHVAAYEVEHEREGKKKRITFIDTPGHAAFTAIRARGATVADIAILVVAADDGVKAQTLEALQSIRDAKTPFIVAINKIDKPAANVERTLSTLSENGVFVENRGGDVPWAEISAKVGTGVHELLDLILLVAEVQELKGSTDAPATGYVIEAHRDKKRGIAATLIIRNGTLKSGQFVRAGAGVAPVRIMENHLGLAIKEASLSQPVQLIGFDELPGTGADFHSHTSKREAEDARTSDMLAHKTAATTIAVSTDDCYQMPVIIRADTTGSLAAIAQETAKIGDEHARVSIVQSGIGIVSENDVKAAQAAGDKPAMVIGFNVGIERAAENYARERGVAVESFDIIYKLTERLEELLKANSPKRTQVSVSGRARIIKKFSTTKDEHVIGAKVLDGFLAKKSAIRVLRRNVEICTGAIINLQSNKQNVDKVETEGEFGAQIECEFEPAQGDVLEAIVTTTI